MTFTTTQTLTALRAIAALDFGPLGRTDRLMYEGASPDAVIASGQDASVLVDLLGEDALEVGPGTMDVVISAERIELYACKPDGEQVVAHLTVGEGF